MSQHFARATTSAAFETTLLNYVNNWINTMPVGYDIGKPKADYPDVNNDIGRDYHRDAPRDGVYYSLLGQNCVWWATIMLKQSGIPVPTTVYNTIAAFNLGQGGGPDVVTGRRSATEVNTLHTLTPMDYASVLPTLDAYIDNFAFAFAYFGVV